MLSDGERDLLEAERLLNMARLNYKVAVNFPEGANLKVYSVRVETALRRLRVAEQHVERMQVPVFGKVMQFGREYKRPGVEVVMSPVLIANVLAELGGEQPERQQIGLFG